jgi:hypothetical protein
VVAVPVGGCTSLSTHLLHRASCARTTEQAGESSLSGPNPSSRRLNYWQLYQVGAVRARLGGERSCPVPGGLGAAADWMAVDKNGRISLLFPVFLNSDPPLSIVQLRNHTL